MLIFRSAVDNEVLPACEADVRKRDRRPGADGDGYAQAELSPSWVERKATAGFLRLLGDSSAGGVTVPVLYLMLTPA